MPSYIIESEIFGGGFASPEVVAVGRQPPG
jgi:hypothetical protein